MLTTKQLVACALLSLAPIAVQAQQTYPGKPIRLLVGFPAGGGSDILARALGQRLTEVLGQQITIDNRPGAGGIIATELGAKAPADGYTLLLGSPGGFAINPNLVAKLPYNPVKDFAPIGMFATLFYVVGVHPSLPAKSLKDLIALAKARPGQINYGSSGQGANIHLSIEQLAMMAGIKMTHVPYKGNAPMLTALMSGEVALVFDPVVTALPMVRSGRMRALAVTMSRRSVLLPDVPTVSEAGVKGYESINWFAIFAPAGTPRPIIERLNAAINQAVTSPALKEKMQNEGVEPVTGTPEDLGKLVQSELAKFATIIKAAQIRVN